MTGALRQSYQISTTEIVTPSEKEEPAIIEYTIDATGRTHNIHKLDTTDTESIILDIEGKYKVNEINCTIDRRGDLTRTNCRESYTVACLESNSSNAPRCSPTNPIFFAVDKRKNPFGTVENYGISYSTEEIITEQISKVTMSDLTIIDKAGQSRAGSCGSLGRMASLENSKSTKCLLF